MSNNLSRLSGEFRMIDNHPSLDRLRHACLQAGSISSIYL